MINGSFVFGLDGDDPDVFRRTVDWAVESGITTATFHIADALPGHRAARADVTRRGASPPTTGICYDTRHVVYRPIGLSADELKRGYDWSYRAFYEWGAIVEGRVGAPLAEALAEAFRLQRGMEEVRAGVGLRHPPQATVADAAAARGVLATRSTRRGRRIPRLR